MLVKLKLLVDDRPSPTSRHEVAKRRAMQAHKKMEKEKVIEAERKQIGRE